MNNLPKTLLKAKNSKNIVATTTLRKSDLDCDRLYIQSVSDKLIEDVGRFCEQHKTDFLISWDTLIQHIKTDTEGIHFFGIRRLGVDHNTYVYINLQNHKDDYSYVSEHYRKLYAVYFHTYEDEYGETLMDVDLKDVTGLNYDKEDDDFDINTIENIIKAEV